ncbi:MAG: sigma 54-interacting transcriptional regulator [Thermoanaerobaculales bacterium]
MSGKLGPWLRLGALPHWRLEELRLERRLRAAFGASEMVLPRTLGPLLRALLPERAADFDRAAASRPAWEASAAWLGVLLGEGRDQVALRHPSGMGRALWARRFALPESGVSWVEEETVLPGLVAATRLARLGRDVTVAAGAWEEEDVARAQARAAAAGRDVVALTTLSFPGLAPLPLAGGIEAVWLLAERSELAFAHAGLAVEVGRKRPAFAAAALQNGARTGFSGPPQAVEVTREQEALASPAARRALSWLASAPVGLETAEVCALADAPDTALPEIERLRLAQQRSGAWRAAQLDDAPDEVKLAAMAAHLGESSAAGAVARALARGEFSPVVAWCEGRLARGAVRAVLAVAREVPGPARLRLAAAEAALSLGRLEEAEKALQAVEPHERGPVWHALTAWWAEGAGLPEGAAAELPQADGTDLPERLVARCELVAAELARRAGDGARREAHLHRALLACDPPLLEAELALADLQGPGALRTLRRARRSVWGGDLNARAMHLTGSAAFARGAWVAGATAQRAALRLATGENPCWLGEIHADLGFAAMFTDRPGVADRHLKLAESILERCGSRRASTVVRANRAVLACDRLDWRQARELTLAARELRGTPDDAATCLGEIELARAELARGDIEAVQGLLPQLRTVTERHREHAVVSQAFAGLRAHLALAVGDLGGAQQSAEPAEAGEKALVHAVVEADRGCDPPSGLPQRWGVVVTAQLLAAWRRGDGEWARAWLTRAFDRIPREAAVGVVRFLALLARRGEHLDPGWADLERRAEAVLVAANLDGWAALLRRSSGLDPLRLVQALDRIVNAGADGLAPTRLEALARALGLRGLAFEGAEVHAGWGDVGDDAVALEVGGVTVRALGIDHAVATAALELVARHISLRRDAAPGDPDVSTSGLLGSSKETKAVREQIARWGPLPLTVVITGEPGTGKELVARELHAASRRRGSFIPINCAGIPSALLEAELFGVIRGAFTGADRDRAGLVEAAEGGTLFLDEVGELPMELQGKLLRLLQEHEVRRVGATRSRVVDVRFVAATNRNLTAAVAAGGFRQDLYYRLAVAVIEVPPLRERPGDIEELARYFAARLGATLNRPGVRLAPATVAELRRGGWPGNVRELESAVARAVAGARPGEILGPDRFPGLVQSPTTPQQQLPWSKAVVAFRRAYFADLLNACDGNRSRAARQAGISRQTLLYHLRELGLQGELE